MHRREKFLRILRSAHLLASLKPRSPDSDVRPTPPRSARKSRKPHTLAQLPHEDRFAGRRRTCSQRAGPAPTRSRSRIKASLKAEVWIYSLGMSVGVMSPITRSRRACRSIAGRRWLSWPASFRNRRLPWRTSTAPFARSFEFHPFTALPPE